MSAVQIILDRRPALTSEEDEGQRHTTYRSRQLDDVSEKAFRDSEAAGCPNFAILVLAVGQWASRPSFREWKGPTWALEACQKYFNESVVGTRKIGAPQQGSPGRKDDGQVLTLVAQLLTDPDVRVALKCFNDGAKLSDNRAIRIAISQTRGIPRAEVQQGDINRIAYHWKIDEDRRLTAACEAYGRKLMKKNPLQPK